MALEQLLASIEAEARAQIEAELENGRREAEDVAAAEVERAAAELEIALAREEMRVRGELEHELAAARGEGRRQVFEARQRFIDRVHEAVAERLPPLMGDERYLGSLAGQLDACLDYVGDTPVTVEATPALVSRLRELVADRETIAVEPDPSLTTGFRIVAENQRLSIDATLERAFEHRKRELEIALFRELEGVA